ncbi:MAG: ABC transporter ATP-binding protein [Thermoplasmata archaeon]
MSGWVIESLESDLAGFHLGPVDLALPPGAAVAVLGRSGAGKTTLLRTLAGFLEADRGRILRDGTDVAGWLPERRGLGYVPQGLGLFPHRTVERNVRYPLELRERTDAKGRARELLERFSLTALAQRRPSQLSGGEAQRVALARALAAEPELILWDEPWQALDVESRHELGQVLHDLRETDRVPVIVVTHDPGLAFSLADRFLLLRNGRVELASDASALLDAPPDAFAARFVGFENVFDRPRLERGGPGGLGAWLLDRAGPEGIAFAAPGASADGPPHPWTGTVRSARPTPDGVVVEILADGLPIVLRTPRSRTQAPPLAGSRIGFAIDSLALCALGASRRSAPELR